MSITSALNNALTGLNATSRQAEAVSSNVANATTPGYAKRSVALSAAQLGGDGSGVRILGITRHTDLYLINDRRDAHGAAAESEILAQSLQRMEAIFGDSDDPGALTARVNILESTLLEAASHPESDPRLASAVSAARSLATGINDASRAIQAERMQADRSIASVVDRLNAGLKQVEDLNQLIVKYGHSGGDVAAFIDQRQAVIDDLSSIIPLRELPRENNVIALISSHGALLLDGKASKFSFTATSLIVPEMSVAGGVLSGLLLNSRPIATSGSTSLIGGGGLAAQFAIRDDLAVQAQSLLDTMARDMVERFSAPGLDASLAAGMPGLFTESGGAIDPANLPGLSERLRVNDALDPASGGSPYRLRDGIAATSPGNPGNSALLSALATALAAPRVITGAMLSGSMSLPELASAALSRISTHRVTQDSDLAFRSARHATLVNLEAKSAVNVDEEMQNLLVIEKNYAANARVIQAVDEMIRILMEL